VFSPKKGGRARNGPSLFPSLKAATATRASKALLLQMESTRLHPLNWVVISFVGKWLALNRFDSDSIDRFDQTPADEGMMR
jgi:hypothetical protein